MKKIVKITTIEERRINMIEGIEEEHIYENPKNIKRTRMWKPLCWLPLLYKEGRKNYTRGKQNIRKQLNN